MSQDPRSVRTQDPRLERSQDPRLERSQDPRLERQEDPQDPRLDKPQDRLEKLQDPRLEKPQDPRLERPQDRVSIAVFEEQSPTYFSRIHVIILTKSHSRQMIEKLSSSSSLGSLVSTPTLDSAPIRFEHNAASVILTKEFFDKFSKDADIMPKFYDPIADTYRKADMPIQPLSTYSLQLLAAAYQAHNEDETTAMKSAVRRERIWRIVRWAKFYQYPCLPTQFAEADITALEAIIVIHEKNHTANGPRSISEIMMAVRTLGTMRDNDCVDFIVSKKIIRKAIHFNWRKHSYSLNEMNGMLVLLGTMEIACPIIRQTCQASVMEQWWQPWDLDKPNISVQRNPFTAFKSRAADGDFVSSNHREFIQKLLSAAKNSSPRSHYNSIKNQGWPGYTDFRETVEGLVARVLEVGNNSIKNIRDPAIQTDATILSLARLYVAEPVWLAAFGESPPTTLDNLITGVIKVQHDPRYSSYRLWKNYGIGTNAGLCETPVVPWSVKYEKSDRFNEETPCNLLATLWPEYCTSDECDTPLYRHTTAKKSSTNIAKNPGHADYSVRRSASRDSMDRKETSIQTREAFRASFRNQNTSITDGGIRKMSQKASKKLKMKSTKPWYVTI